jgi:hypothetical protein
MSQCPFMANRFRPISQKSIGPRQLNFLGEWSLPVADPY